MNQHTGTECNNCFYTTLRIEKCCYIYLSHSSRLKPTTSTTTPGDTQHSPLQMETQTLTCTLQQQPTPKIPAFLFLNYEQLNVMNPQLPCSKSTNVKKKNIKRVIKPYVRLS